MKQSFKRLICAAFAFFSWAIPAPGADQVDCNAYGLSASDPYDRAGRIATCNFCNGYAQKAVESALELQKHPACLAAVDIVVRPSRWTTDFMGHFAWCASSDDASVIREMEKRTQGLAACVYREGFCARYADQAAADARTNWLMGCGFTGDRWGLDRNAHFFWCMTQETEAQDDDCWGISCLANISGPGYWDEGFIRSETADRAQAIAECKLDHPPKCLICHSSNSGVAASLLRGGTGDAGPAKPTQRTIDRIKGKAATANTGSKALVRDGGGTAADTGPAKSTQSAIDRLSGGGTTKNTGSKSLVRDGDRRAYDAKPASNPGNAPGGNIGFGVQVRQR